MCPSEHQHQLRGQEHADTDDQAGQVQANLEPFRSEGFGDGLRSKRLGVVFVVVFNRFGFLLRAGYIVQLLCILHLLRRLHLLLPCFVKLVCDEESVRDEHVLAQVAAAVVAPPLPGPRRPPRQRILYVGDIPPPPAVGADPRFVSAEVVLVHALHRRTRRHTGGHQRAELHHLACRELERVEARDQRLRVVGLLAEGAEDAALGGAAGGVQQNDLVQVVAVLGHQLPDENLIRGVEVEDGEVELQRVPHRGGLDRPPTPLRHAHHHCRGLYLPFLHQRRLDLALDLEVEAVGDGLIAEVVLAVERQPEVGARHYTVVVLDNHLQTVKIENR